MPRYEYGCAKCGRCTDHDVAFDKRPQTIKCECGGRAEYGVSAVFGRLKGTTFTQVADAAAKIGQSGGLFSGGEDARDSEAWHEAQKK